MRLRPARLPAAASPGLAAAACSPHGTLSGITNVGTHRKPVFDPACQECHQPIFMEGRFCGLIRRAAADPALTHRLPGVRRLRLQFEELAAGTEHPRIQGVLEGLIICEVPASRSRPPSADTARGSWGQTWWMGPLRISTISHSPFSKYHETVAAASSDSRRLGRRLRRRRQAGPKARPRRWIVTRSHTTQCGHTTGRRRRSRRPGAGPDHRRWSSRRMRSWSIAHGLMGSTAACSASARSPSRPVAARRSAGSPGWTSGVPPGRGRRPLWPPWRSRSARFLELGPVRHRPTQRRGRPGHQGS